MARKKGMAGGPGAGVMGGAGAKPRVPPTAAAGRGTGAPAAGAMAGLAPPMPGGVPRGGGGGGGGMGGSPGFARGGHVESEKTKGIMEKKRERHEALEKGGVVGHEGHKPIDYPRKSSKADSQIHQQVRDHKERSKHEEKSKQVSEGKAGFQRGGAPGIGKAPSMGSSRFEKGGYVETDSPRSAPGRGIDSKPRVGRDAGGASRGD